MLLAGVILAVGVALSPVLQAGFLTYDDPMVITDNPPVLAGWTGPGIAWAFTTNHFANWMPLTWLTHLADVSLWGVRPFGHHLTNLVCHLAAVTFVFLAVRAMGGPALMAALVAGGWGLHPLHVESVAWIAERKGVLANLFVTLSIWLHLVGRDPRIRLLAVLAFGLSLLAKQSGVMLPALLVLLDRRAYWPDPANPAVQEATRRPVTPEPGRIRIPGKIPFILLAAGFMVVAYASQSGGGAISDEEDLPFRDRLAQASVALVAYPLKLLWPIGTGPFHPHAGAQVPTWAAVALLLPVAALSWMALVAWWRRGSWIALGWLWYLGALQPVAGWIPIGRHGLADRYADLPSLGLWIALAAWWCRPSGVRSATVSDPSAAPVEPTLLQRWAPLPVALVLGTLTFAQASRWRDDEALFTPLLHGTDEGRRLNATGHWAVDRLWDPRPNPMAANQVALTRFRAGKIDEAERLYTDSTRADPTLPFPWIGLAQCRRRLGRPAEAEAAAREAVRHAPGMAGGWQQLGMALMDQRKPKEAADAFARVVDLEKDDIEDWRRLAAALALDRRPAEAAEALTQALTLPERTPADIVQLARARFDAGQPALAAEVIQSLIAGGMRSADLVETLANARIEANQLAAAEPLVATLERVRPPPPGAALLRARLLLLAPDPGTDAARALTLLDSIGDRAQASLDWLEARALALERLGRRAEALTQVEAARPLAETQGAPDWRLKRLAETIRRLRGDP
jgi:tetratricopeptide (TPR) repeat protein